MILKLMDITKKYGDKTVLDHVNLTLTPGIYALLGPNGAGKSTLMNLITQNLLPTEGSILYNGEDIRKLGKSYRSLLGFMPQQQGLYETFTANRFLSYIASLKGMDKKTARNEIPRVLSLVNLTEQADQKISTFSGGMKQRLLIAQSIMDNPKILILDEPTAGLDPKERIRIRNIVSEIASDKIVIFATHVVSDIEHIAKEVILIRSGIILRQENPDTLTKELSGKVFDLKLTEEQLPAVKEQYTIRNILQKDSFLIARILADEPPIKYTRRKAVPDLEDVYLYYFESHKEG